MHDISVNNSGDQPTSNGVRVNGSNTPAKILLQLPNNGRGWYLLKPRDYPIELRSNTYLKLFNKKGREQTTGSRGDANYIYVFERLRPINNNSSGGGGSGSTNSSGNNNQNNNINPLIIPPASKVEPDTTPTVLILSPKTGIEIDLTDKKIIKKNIIDHTVKEGETAESIVKNITGKTDTSAIIDMTPKAYHPGDKLLSGYQMKIENGLALKINGSVTNSTVVELNVTGSVSGSKTINVDKAGPNVAVNWDAEIPMQGGHGPLKIEANAGDLPAVSEPEIAKPNWVDIEYKVEGRSFNTEGIVILRFENGTTLKGTLDNGLSHFPLVPFMPFSVEFLPTKEKKKELDKLYDELDKILTQEVEKAKQEAAPIKEAYKKLPWFIKNKVNEFYTLKGVGHWVVDTAKGIWSLVFGAAKVVVQTQAWMAKFHLHHLKMGTCSISGDQDCVKSESEQIQAMLKEVGDDVSKAAETAETLYYLANDGKTGKRIAQFGKEYFSALSVPQQHQFVARHGVDILLIFVAGSGAVLLGVKNAGKITAIIKKIAAILKTFPTKLKFKKAKKDVNNKNTFPPKTKVFEDVKLDSSGKFMGQHNAGSNAPNYQKWIDKGGTIKYDKDTGTIIYGKAINTANGNKFIEVPYKKGPPGNDRYPDFSKHSKEQVQIKNMSGDVPEKIIKPPPGQGDFSKAWEALEKEKGANKVSEYGITKRTSGDRAGIYQNLNAEGTTWHHVQDTKTMQLVDKDIHAEFSHKGGASVVKENITGEL